MAANSRDGLSNGKGSEGDGVKKTKASASPKPTAKKAPATQKTIKEQAAPAISIKTKSPESKVTGPSVTDSTPPIEIGSGGKPSGVAKGAVLKDNHNLRKNLLKVALVVIGILVVVIVVFGVLIYGYKSEDSVVQAVAQVIPYPVEQVNGQFVSVKDYFFEVNANEKAYQYNAKLNNQSPVNFNSPAGKKLVTQIKQHTLTQLETEVLTAQLASQKKVVVTNAQVNTIITQLYARYGGKATLLKTLNQIYGWNLEDLQGVIRKQLLSQDLQTKVTSDPSLEAPAKSKAESILQQIKNGADFSTLAKSNSQSSDASSGGDLGYVTKGQIPANEWSAAEALQAGAVSDVIQTQYGFEIIKVLDKKSDGSIHIQHILIETVDFNTWLQQQINKAKVSIYLTS